jgi:transcriptional regulator with XRE-family HTH domain
MQVTLKQARQLRGLTQIDLANLTGLSEPTIVKYEKDEADMKISTAWLMAEKLGITFDGLSFAVSDSVDVVGATETESAPPSEYSKERSLPDALEQSTLVDCTSGIVPTDHTDPPWY